MKNEIERSVLPRIALQYGIRLFLQTATGLGQIKSPFDARFFPPVEDTHTRIARVTRPRGLLLPPAAIKAYLTTLKMTHVRLTWVPPSLSASQIFKNKRKHFLTSQKCLKTLKNEVLEELVVHLGLQNTLGSMEWRLAFQNV